MQLLESAIKGDKLELLSLVFVNYSTVHFLTRFWCCVCYINVSARVSCSYTSVSAVDIVCCCLSYIRLCDVPSMQKFDIVSGWCFVASVYISLSDD